MADARAVNGFSAPQDSHPKFPRRSDAMVDYWLASRGHLEAEYPPAPAESPGAPFADGLGSVARASMPNLFSGIPMEADPSVPPREAKWEARKDKVWPSEAFFDEWGSKDPGWQSRVGQLQAATMGAANGFGFGVPKALLRRFAPEQAAKLDGVSGAAGYAGMGGEIAGSVANPLGRFMRAGGDALAAKGYGMSAQMGADAATAGAAYGTADLIDPTVSDPSMLALRFAMPNAAALRYVSPGLNPNIGVRAATGAGVGMAVQAPQAIIDPGQLLAVPAGGVIGGLQSATMKRGSKAPDYHSVEDRLINTIGLGTVPATGLQLLRTIDLPSQRKEAPPPARED